MSADREWRLLFEDIMEAAEKIERYTDGMELQDFVHNSLVIDAVMRNLAIVGEAARHVPADIRDRCPEVAWRQMSDMRNVLIHAYTRVNLTIVWDAIKQNLPPSIVRLRQFLEAEQDAD